jgi:hypothetical protein
MFGLEHRQFLSDDIIAAQRADGASPGKLILDWFFVLDVFIGNPRQV